MRPRAAGRAAGAQAVGAALGLVLLLACRAGGAAVPGPRLTLDGAPLDPADRAGVEQAVRAWNAAQDSPRLPAELNARTLRLEEVQAFLARLAAWPDDVRRALAGETLELTSRALRLGPLDGFGAHGWRGAVRLVRTPEGWAPEPRVDPVDLEAALGTAAALVREREAARSDAEARFAATVEGTPAWSAAFRTWCRAKGALGLALSAEIALLAHALDWVDAPEGAAGAGGRVVTIEGKPYDRAGLLALRDALSARAATCGPPREGLPGAPRLPALGGPGPGDRSR